MKVAVIFLDYLRQTYSDRVRATNLYNAGYPFDLYTIEERGLSRAFNKGLDMAAGADAFVFMANDIIMPDNWLAEMVRHYEAIPNTGVIGIYTVEYLGPVSELNGLQVHVTDCPFGNQFIPAKLVAKIGGYNEDYDPYGMQDRDYCLRANLAGYVNYYLPNMKAEHIGYDVGQATEYRKMKDEGLNQSIEKWHKWNDHYHNTGDIAHYTIDMQQFYGENN